MTHNASIVSIFSFYSGEMIMWKQFGFRFEDIEDLNGIWDSIPVDQQQEFVRVYSMLLVRLIKKQLPTELEFDHE